MLARTALSAAVTVALVSVPATISVPAFGSVADSVLTAPSTSQSSSTPAATETQGPTSEPTETPHADPSPTGSPDDEESHEAEDEESELPDGTFEVHKASAVDTFALYQEGSSLPFVTDPRDEDFNPESIVVDLRHPDTGAERDFALKHSGALNLVTDGGGNERYKPEANGEGDRTFEFEVTDGAMGEISETTPRSEPTPGPTDEPSASPSPTDDPTADPSPDPSPGPTEDPTPTGTPDPPSEPTDDPDDGDDREDEGNDGGGPGDDESDSGERDDGGLTDDPSTGNGSDNGGRDDPRGTAPSGNNDWVPTGPQRPDYSDPVPQPPGANEDDAITPDGEAPTQPAGGEYGDDGSSDDVATDSASEDGNGAGMPWQIGVVVAIGASAIGFILFVAGRRRKD